MGNDFSELSPRLAERARERNAEGTRWEKGGERRHADGDTMKFVGSAYAAPLLVVEDVILGGKGVLLMPPVARAGLHLEAGDAVDVVEGDRREEVVVLAIEPDTDAARVRLRVKAGVPIAAGVEIWRSQAESGVILRRPERVVATSVR